MIKVYTDGSSRGNPGPGGWGAIIAYDKKQEVGGKKYEWVSELGGSENHTTNNRMELTAAIEALKFLTPYSLLSTTIHTDSEYVMKGITEWVHGWQKRGWKTAAKKPVLNQDLWLEMLKEVEGKSIEWKYVAGHSGHAANERCDEIATSCADGKNVALYNGPRSAYPLAL